MSDVIRSIFRYIRRNLPTSRSRCIVRGEVIDFTDMMWPFCSERCMKECNDE